MYEDYVNGFVERTRDGYAGRITIEGINLGEIVATYFKKENETFLWLRRMKILEYDDVSQSYVEREARPKWECYLKKQVDDNVVAFKGEFNFMRFRFSIAGVWDGVLGMDKHRLNLYVERMEKRQQRIINNINERKKNEQKR
jgi:hypothetical protein